MRASDGALWASVAATLRDVVLPAIDDGHARIVTTQLVGLAEHAITRGPDPEPDRAAELTVALAALAGNPLVPPDPGPAPDLVAGALAAAAGRNDEAATAVRATLRPILIRHLDDDLAAGEVLGAVFRGRLPDG
jgi:MoxR-like ATPase